MNDAPWVLVNTETAALRAPIPVLAIGAQRMRGWEPDGPPFQRRLDRNRDVPSEAAPESGEAENVAEDDGEPTEAVYAAFADYAGELPLCSWNLHYHLDRVLLPEWERLGIDPIGARGFCVLRLAQRLLDPAPDGDTQLQKLRRCLREPLGDAPSALDKLRAAIEVIGQVLRPSAQSRGLDSWGSVCDFTTREWYPVRIGFGRFKGRPFQDARNDGALRDWLVRLSRSPNARNAAVGTWYLARLADLERRGAVPRPAVAGLLPDGEPGVTKASLVTWTDPKIEEWKRRIEGARERLAEVEAEYTNLRARTAFVESRLYALLRDRYERRDRLALLVEYRRRYVETLLQDGEEEAESVAGAHEEVQADLGADYESLDRDAQDRAAPTPGQKEEIGALWRKLVRLYHPDRHAKDPEKQQLFDLVMQAINQARDNGDVTVLREIANDPDSFVRRQGWGSLDTDDDDDLDRLQEIYDALQTRIDIQLDRLKELHGSATFDLCQQVEATPGLLHEIAEEQQTTLDDEIAELGAEARQLAEEIEELTGEPCRVDL